MVLSSWDLVGPIVALALGLVLLARARRGVAVVREVWTRPPRPIAALACGPAVATGTLHAARAPGYALNGQPAVAVHTRVEALVSSGKSASWIEAGRCTEVVEAELRDASGAACAVQLEQPVIVGPMWRATTDAFTLQRQAPSIAARTLVDPGRGNYAGHQLRVTQTVIAEGAAVMVEGEAVEAGLIGGEGYRDVRTRFALRGSDQSSVLLSGLGPRATLWRAAWPVLTVASCGALLVVLALGWVGASVWLAARLP